MTAAADPQLTLIRAPEGRVEYDYYPTPAWMVDHLLDDLEANGLDPRAFWRLNEPCVGAGRINRAVSRRWKNAEWTTNDLDPRWPADSHMDAGDRYFSGFQYGDELAAFGPCPHWVISNPPFNEASTIVPRALDAASRGVAMLLRVTWLEPVEGRGDFLERCPPDRMIVMPRWSFRRNKKQDSATTVWMIWSGDVRPGIVVKQHRGKQEAMDL